MRCVKCGSLAVSNGLSALSKAAAVSAPRLRQAVQRAECRCSEPNAVPQRRDRVRGALAGSEGASEFHRE
jgi:hypothetical protein